MKNLLELSHLNKDYGSFRLRDVSFSVPGGSIMGFIGENGAGKTTTIKLILDVVRRDSGSVKAFGLSVPENDLEIKEQLGVVFDESCFYGELRPRDIQKILKPVYKSWDDGLYGRYLSQFHLPEGKLIKEFSKGMKMKLSIAAALAHHPRLLILDEATSGLDPVMRSEILDLLLDFIQDEEHAVLFSSHITADLERAADYITLIHDGQIVFSRQKDDLIESLGVLKGGAEDLKRLQRADVLRYRKNAFGFEALVADRRTAVRRYPGLVADGVTLDDLMLFYGKGETL